MKMVSKLGVVSVIENGNRNYLINNQSGEVLSTGDWTQEGDLCRAQIHVFLAMDAAPVMKMSWHNE